MCVRFPYCAHLCGEVNVFSLRVTLVFFMCDLVRAYVLGRHFVKMRSERPRVTRNDFRVGCTRDGRVLALLQMGQPRIHEMLWRLGAVHKCQRTHVHVKWVTHVQGNPQSHADKPGSR